MQTTIVMTTLTDAMRRIGSAAACLLGASLIAMTTAHAAARYDEVVSGDLADEGSIPSALSLAPGSNEIFGSMGFIDAAFDRDYFSVTVPVGKALSKIMLLPGSEVAVAVSFLGLQAGSAFTIPPTATTAAGMLGWTHYTDPGPGGTDLLLAMSVANLGSSGFETPLAAGTYSLWVQDFDGPATYGFDFIVTPVPGAAYLMLSGLALLGRTALRRGPR